MVGIVWGSRGAPLSVARKERMKDAKKGKEGKGEVVEGGRHRRRVKEEGK